MRERFPYAEDREIIRQFLMGNPARSEDSYLTSEDGKLKFHGVVIASYDTAGTLTVMLSLDATTASHYVLRAANFMLEEVGSEQRISRENVMVDDVPTFEWGFEGRVIQPNEPLPLVGAMGLAAYRASVSNRKEK